MHISKGLVSCWTTTYTWNWHSIQIYITRDLDDLLLSFLLCSLNLSAGSSSSSPASVANYRAGFNQCASEITRVLTGLGNTDSTLRSRLLEHLATRCLVTKPVDAADARGQLPQVSFPNQPILPKPPISVSSPSNFSFLPQSSPRVLPATQYHLASYPLTNGKVAVLLPTVNPFLMDSAPAGAAQPNLFPIFSKDPKHSVTPPEVMPLGLDTRPLFWKSMPWKKRFILDYYITSYHYFSRAILLLEIGLSTFLLVFKRI